MIGSDSGARHSGTDSAAQAPHPRGWRARLALNALDYRIPAAANRWTYMLGGLTAALLVLLVVTGVYLGQFYQPNPVGARDSVLYIITRAPLGDWVRSVHYWAAGALAVTITAHLAHVFWRRSYLRPRELTWWAGVVLAGLVFLLTVTGTVLRADQEGFEALAHFTAGGDLLSRLGGSFFTNAFTPSTTLLARIFSLHTSLLPLLTLAVVALHFWLIRHIGIHAHEGGASTFRVHATRLAGATLLAYALVGLLALLAPEGLGYPPVPGFEVTKPFWPVLWVYGLENLLGAWGMVVGPLVLGGFLLVLPLLDRADDHRPGIRHPAGWVSLALGVLLLGFWLYGWLGEARSHMGM